MQTTPDGAGRLAYEVQGTGAPIVFLHGLTFDRTTWQPIADLMRGEFSCILVDLPGHGDSAGPPRPIDELAGAVHELLDSLGVAKPVVIGHSFSASLASMYAGSYPVAGVVNVDQPLNMLPMLGVLQQMQPALRGANFAAAFEPFRQSMGVDLLPEPLRSAVTAHQTIEQSLVLGYWDEALRTDPAQLQQRFDDGLDTISAPYLAIFGKRLSDQDRGHFQQHVKALEIEEWPGEGHMVHLMDPGRFAARVATFAAACRHRANPGGKN